MQTLISSGPLEYRHSLLSDTLAIPCNSDAATYRVSATAHNLDLLLIDLCYFFGEWQWTCAILTAQNFPNTFHTTLKVIILTLMCTAVMSYLRRNVSKFKLLEGNRVGPTSATLRYKNNSVSSFLCLLQGSSNGEHAHFCLGGFEAF